MHELLQSILRVEGVLPPSWIAWDPTRIENFHHYSYDFLVSLQCTFLSVETQT